MRIDMVHPLSVPSGAAGLEYRPLADFPLAISGSRKLYNLEGANVSTITVLGIPDDRVVYYQDPTARPGNAGISLDDGASRVLAPRPHEFISMI
jgi:hypothetical protein